MCLCACARRVHIRAELLELLSELITKTASNNGAEELSMDSLSRLDSLSQLQNPPPTAVIRCVPVCVHAHRCVPVCQPDGNSLFICLHSPDVSL